MHVDDEDTVPQGLRARVLREAPGADASDVAWGDTVVRGSVPGSASLVVDEQESVPAPPAAPAPLAAPVLPPVPVALRRRHRVRIGAGEPIVLDRPVHIGRGPREPRIPVGPAPQLVAVESPDGGISSTHLEVREFGTAVVATDMRTLNGSEVRVPGSPVHVLRRGESVVVTPGTRIDLGEGVVVEVLGPDGGEVAP